MSNINKIKELCEQYTNLDNDDIKKIQDISSVLKPLADVVNGNVFIDCPTRDLDVAIVVAEQKPHKGASLYKNTVVGEFALRENEPAVLRTLEIGIATKDLKAITQENMNVRQTVAPIKNNNKIIAVLIVEKDVTHRIKKDNQIKILAEGYEQLTNTLISLTDDEDTITNYIDDAIIIFDEDGEARFVNPKAECFYRSLGYKDNIIGMNFDNLSLDKTKYKEVVRNKVLNENEVNIGNLFLKVRYIPLNSKTFKFVMIVKDITLMKEKEKELISKSVAIKEIHHRVKNNLQTIASLLRLQARRSDNEQTKNALYESMNRILSIATTHELLAQECIDEIDIIEVITNIRDNMVRYFSNPNKDIQVDVTGDSLNVSSDVSTSIALVINELLQNSLKYAFSGRNSGRIEINVKKGKIYSTILVEDNGIGFDVNKVRKNSLGLSIVNSTVCDKLKGNINISSNSDGTKILFDFKN